MRRSAAVGALAAVLLALAPAGAEPWLKRGGQDNPASLAAAFPESAALLRRQIGALIEGGKEAEARAALERLAALGYALSPAGQEQTAKFLTPAVRERFAANAAAIGNPATRARVPASFGLVEGAVRTPAGWVASSVTGQNLLLSRDGQRWRSFDATGMASFSGLTVDPRSGLVWASAGQFEQTPKPANTFSGLVLVDPRRGRIVRKVAAPAGVVPSDITIGPDGTLFVSDPVGGSVWQARPGASELAPLVAPGLLRSPQGLALSQDRKRLYVSDYGSGIAVVDLAGGTVMRLAADTPMMLDGIDGLIRYGNELIAIQNGTRPMRIVSIRLSADGKRAAAMRILMQRLPGGGEPTTGQVRGGQLHYVANARWDLYGQSGALAKDAVPGATEVHSLPLSPK